MGESLKNLNSLCRFEFILWVILSFLIFSFRYDAFPTFVFDEMHYIPSSLEWLSGKVFLNYEHPPLGKLFIALGISLFGDNPLGWRFTGLVAGSLLVGVIFMIGELLAFHHRATIWKPVSLARMCAFLTITNFVLFVQSRTAMLDIFMMLFLALTWFYGFKIFFQNKKNFKYWILLALFGGLSASCKWTGGIWFALFTTVLILFTTGRANRNSIAAKQLPIIAGVALLSYLFPFTSYLFVETSRAVSVWDLPWNFQIEMLELQRRVVGTHPYSSPWYTWILSLRPIWFAFEIIPNMASWCRGVFFVANPLLTVGSAASYLFLLYRSILYKNAFEIFLIVLTSIFTIQWAFIPRNITFYFYYFPNIMFLTLVLSYVIFIKNCRVLIWTANIFSLVLFVYFYPVLSAMKFDVKHLSWWIWFQSWL